MSKINSGILGPFSGTIGNVRGYRRNGKNIIQSIERLRSVNQLSGLIDNSNRAKQMELIVRKYQRGIFRIMTGTNCNNKLSYDQLIIQNLDAINWNYPTYFLSMKLTDESWFSKVTFNPILLPAINRVGNEFAKAAKLRMLDTNLDRYGFVDCNQNGTYSSSNVAFTNNSYSTNSLYPAPNSTNYYMRGVRIFSSVAGNKGIIRISGAGLTW